MPWIYNARTVYTNEMSVHQLAGAKGRVMALIATELKIMSNDRNLLRLVMVVT